MPKHTKSEQRKNRVIKRIRKLASDRVSKSTSMSEQRGPLKEFESRKKKKAEKLDLAFAKRFKKKGSSHGKSK